VILDEMSWRYGRLCDELRTVTPETYRGVDRARLAWYFAAPAGSRSLTRPGAGRLRFDVRGGGRRRVCGRRGSVHPSGVRYTAEEPDASRALPAWLMPC